jgi:carotenoid cleavage dioxygenase
LANTTPIWHAGKLLALKEDSLPVELDPETLETVGRIDYAGQVKSKTFTAHPKIDPVSGNMFTFGYAAKGETTRDVAFYIIDATGKVIREEWFEAPYAAEIHDFVVTQEHVIFPIFPTTTDMERIKAGGPHWQWDPTLPTFVGIFPLSGTVKDMKWYKAPARKGYHFFNAYTKGNKVIVDGTIADAELFPFFYADPEKNFDPTKAFPLIRRWTFDLDSNGSEFKEEVLSDQYAEFPRIDERFMTQAYRYGYVIANDPSRDFTGGGIFGPAFNTITRYDFESGQSSSYALDDKSVAQEPVFVPRYPDAPEGDGYLIALVARYDTMLNDLLVLDAMDLASGPIATIHLPIRLRLGVHVNWVPEHVLKQHV